MRYDNYYSDTYGRAKRGRFTLWAVVRLLFFVVSLLSAIALLLTLLSPYVPPHVWWVFPVLGLVSPAVYVINFLIAMVLLVRWRWQLAIPTLVLLLMGAGFVTRFVRIEIQKDYGISSSRGVIKILSYNLRSHINDEGQWSTAQITQYLDSLSPDIFCLQELRADMLEQMLPEKMKRYHRATFAEIGIYSRYPIVAQSQAEPPVGEVGEVSYSMWADIKIGEKIVRVFNNHMASTLINLNDDRYITSRKFVTDSLREDRIIDILSRFKRSSVHRSYHADSIKLIINSSPHPVIVCGDFNDTPMSYTYNRISEGLQDAFVECGEGYPYTYRGFLNTLRIDYILADQGVTFLSYNINKHVTISDHLPLEVRFKIN